MTKELGLYYPDGTFRSRDEIIKNSSQKPQVIKPQSEGEISFDGELNRIKELRKQREALNIWKEEATIQVDTGDLPYFFVMPLSDIHIGSEFVDYDELDRHLAALRDYPIYTILVGDLGDFFNPQKYPRGMMEDVVTPDTQLLVLRKFFEEYKDKILCGVTGNHDDWLHHVAGIEPFRWISQDLNIPLLYSGGRLNLQVNGIDYRFLLYHGISNFNSSFNPTHAGKRMLELHHDADVVISGDKHRFGMEKLTHRDKKPYIIQLGTFKTKDPFGKRGYGRVPDPKVGYPVLFLSAGEKNVEAIEDLDTAQYFIDLVLGK